MQTAACRILSVRQRMLLGAVSGLVKEMGYVPGQEGWPVITGAGSEAEAVKRVAEGSQSCTVFCDNRTLAQECVEMVTAKLQEKTRSDRLRTV